MNAELTGGFWELGSRKIAAMGLEGEAGRLKTVNWSPDWGEGVGPQHTWLAV